MRQYLIGPSVLTIPPSLAFCSPATWAAVRSATRPVRSRTRSSEARTKSCGNLQREHKVKTQWHQATINLLSEGMLLLLKLMTSAVLRLQETCH